MRWSNHDLMWGRPLRSIVSIFDKKILKFNFQHLTSTNNVIVIENFIEKYKKMKNFKEYDSFLKKNKICLRQTDRQKIIENACRLC